MKKLLITLMLISPFSFADWGDVYYCQMTTHSLTILEGERTDYQLEKFQFKLDKTKNAMVFGKGGYMNGVVAELNKPWRAMVIMETWRADDGGSMSFFSKGKFLYVWTGPSGSKSISADCDKF
jgi:hypothetical protein